MEMRSGGDCAIMASVPTSSTTMRWYSNSDKLHYISYAYYYHTPHGFRNYYYTYASPFFNHVPNHTDFTDHVMEPQSSSTHNQVPETEETKNEPQVETNKTKNSSNYNLIKKVFLQRIANEELAQLKLTEIMQMLGQMDDAYKQDSEGYKKKYATVRRTLTSEKCFQKVNGAWQYVADKDNTQNRRKNPH